MEGSRRRDAAPAALVALAAAAAQAAAVAAACAVAATLALSAALALAAPRPHPLHLGVRLVLRRLPRQRSLGDR